MDERRKSKYNLQETEKMQNLRNKKSLQWRGDKFMEPSQNAQKKEKGMKLHIEINSK